MCEGWRRVVGLRGTLCVSGSSSLFSHWFKCVYSGWRWAVCGCVGSLSTRTSSPWAYLTLSGGWWWLLHQELGAQLTLIVRVNVHTVKLLPHPPPTCRSRVEQRGRCAAATDDWSAALWIQDEIFQSFSVKDWKDPAVLGWWFEAFNEKHSLT